MTVAVEAPPTAPRWEALAAAGLEAAGVDYVVLHEGGADLDIAVGRGSLAAVDAVARSGALGRLVARLDHAVPWCRYYVFAAGEPEGRYRALDVACDPWGIGPYGGAVPRALALAARREDGVRVPAPRAAVGYLAAKRAVKGLRPGDAERLAGLLALEPGGAAELLDDLYGEAGGALAAALAGGRLDIGEELAAVAAALRRSRRTPSALARRAAHGSRRSVRRALRPTGLAVRVAGPDGAGKSTLAARLCGASAGPFRRALRLHLRPGVLPPPARLLGRPAPGGSDPHARPPSGPLLSLLRLAYLWLDTVLGWPARVAAPLRRSTLVVLERGLDDVAVDPGRHRVALPPALLRAATALAPKPAVALVLSAPAETLRARKPELPAGEIERQLEAERRLARRRRPRTWTIDVTGTRDETLSLALDALDDVLAERAGDLGGAALALRCLGRPARGGVAFSVLRVRGRPRFLLAAGAGRPGPSGAGLYRPAGARLRAAALAAEAAHRAGLVRDRIALDPAGGLGPALARALGEPAVELAALVPRPERGGARAVLAVRSRGRLVAYAKVSRARARLARERDVLAALARCRLERLVVPEPLALLDWEDVSALLLAPVPAGGSAAAADGPAVRAALAELALLGPALAPVLGEADGLVPAHGDFAPWNAAALRDGRLAVWDWEEARLGLPLEDLFHWRTRRVALLGRGRVRDAAAAAVAPDAGVRELCRATGADPAGAPAALRAALERAAPPGLRAEALAVLEEAGA